MGNSLFGEKRYLEAAGAYQKLLAKEPGNRDAMFNLANAFFAAGDGAKLVAAAQQLLTIDPMNEDDHKLLSQGYKLQNDTAKMLKAIEKLFLLPTNITVNSFAARKGSTKLMGTATGREALDVSGKVVPPAAVTLVWEFLDVNGAVVASKEVEIPALQPSAKHEFTVDVTGDGIIVWRYRHK
jgi:tetratricopeptide (TPR) repeat protein